MNLYLPVDYTFKTNFEDATNNVHPDDHETLVSASNKFIMDILKLNVTDHNAKSEKRNSVIDSKNGNIYAIHLDYEVMANMEICISYMFKYSEGVAYIHSCSIPYFPYSSITYTPFEHVYPDSTYVYFDKDFNLTAYEINYEYNLQHDDADHSEYADMSYIDFTFYISNKETLLEISYNDYCKEQRPDDYCFVPIRVVDSTDILNESLFYFFLLHHNKPSVCATISYMQKNNLVTASGFKHAYYAFHQENRELLTDIMKLIDMERI